MVEALFLTLIGMGGVFAFLIFVMYAIRLMVFVFPQKSEVGPACAAAVAVALHERSVQE